MLLTLADTFCLALLLLVPVSAADERPGVVHDDAAVLENDEESTLTVSGLPADAPLRVAARASEVQLVVEVALEPGWHLYARDVGGGRPVAVELLGDQPFIAAGPLDAPGDARGEIKGQARLVLPLRRVGSGREIEATFSLQVCDALECLTPLNLTLEGEVAPPRVLLVVAEEGERAERIAGWLRARGFAVTVTRYAEVRREQCDHHDVVVADSDYFGRPGVRSEFAREFPRTSTPIVAVGFLGTELVEAHGLAMTSGYI